MAFFSMTVNLVLDHTCVKGIIPNLKDFPEEDRKIAEACAATIRMASDDN